MDDVFIGEAENRGAQETGGGGGGGCGHQPGSHHHLNQISKIHHVLDALKFLLTLPSYNQETLPGFVPVAQLRAGWAAEENQVNVRPKLVSRI